MTSRFAGGWCALALACGPVVGTADDGGADGDASTSGATAGSATSTGPGSTTTATTTPTTTTSATSMDATSIADTGEVPPCMTGVWVGLYSNGADSSVFSSCETGEMWWFADGAPYGVPCADDIWVRVKGALCGPGEYGPSGAYAYELDGEIVDGPCLADCVGDPDPQSCGSFEALCPSVACDVLAQDCPEHERCVPISFTGAPPWTGSRCVEMGDLPQPVGAPCTIDEMGIDDCVAGALCLVDAGNATSQCRSICGDDLLPCADAGTCCPSAIAESSGLSPFGLCFDQGTDC